MDHHGWWCCCGDRNVLSGAPSPHVGSSVFLAAASGSPHGDTWVAGMCLPKASGCGRLHPGPAGDRLLKQRPIVGCLEDGGIAGFTEEAICTVLCCAPVFLYCDITCRQPRLTTSRSIRQQAWICLGVLLQQGKGVRTGGRPHPGLAGERLPKQRPKPC